LAGFKLQSSQSGIVGMSHCAWPVLPFSLVVSGADLETSFLTREDRSGMDNFKINCLVERVCPSVSVISRILWGSDVQRVSEVHS
jgi:hypothetical protein